MGVLLKQHCPFFYLKKGKGADQVYISCFGLFGRNYGIQGQVRLKQIEILGPELTDI